MATPFPQPAIERVERYLDGVLVGDDEVLSAALAAAAAAGLPDIAVTPGQGKLLHLLARAVGARRVLEVGTLGGYSTIWLARAVGPGGSVVTLEVDPHHAEVARATLAAAGLDGVAEVRLGPAATSLAAMTAPVDLTFIDADKRSTPTYLDHACA